MTQIGSTSSALPNAAAGANADPAARAKHRAELEKAAKGFEAIFVRNLMKSMRETKIDDGIDGSSAVDQFQEVSDANMADSLANKGGLGIAQLMLQQLDKGG